MMLDKQSNIQVWNSILNVIFSASTKHHWLHYYISLLRPSVYQNWIKYFLKWNFQLRFHKIFFKHSQVLESTIMSGTCKARNLVKLEQLSGSNKSAGCSLLSSLNRLNKFSIRSTMAQLIIVYSDTYQWEMRKYLLKTSECRIKSANSKIVWTHSVCILGGLMIIFRGHFFLHY